MLNTLKKNDGDKGEGTVAKTLHLLDIVAAFGRPIRFNEILAQSPYPKPSTYRHLQTLVGQNVLSLNSDGYYNLGSRLIRLAANAWQKASLAPIAAPILDALSQQTGKTIHLAQFDNAQVLYLDKRNAKKPIKMFSDAGKIGPTYCTGIGKAMLAFINESLKNDFIQQQSFYPHTSHTIKTPAEIDRVLHTIRNEGVAFDREEHESGIICVAVPILSQTGGVYGGISITSSTERADIEDLRAYAPSLRAAAQQIGEQAAHWMLPAIAGLSRGGSCQEYS